MGSCFSSSKVSGSNSNTPSATNTNTNTTNTTTASGTVPTNPRETSKAATSTTAVNSRKQEGSNYNQKKHHQQQQKQQPRNSQQNVKTISSRRQSGVIPCGKRTDFGYDKDFEKRYTIGKLLGHGQFGYTYVATDKSSGDRVAVKRIEKNKMVLPIAVEDVKREVKILKALAGHENVVQFYNSFEDENYVYIVMELCEGGELLDRILSKKDSRYTEKDAAIVVRQMLKVAAECHLHGLVHRDMKPENFLFKSSKADSPLKATDFGLSDFIRPGKKFQDIVGSAYYVAPEVLKRRSGPESDVWSIGVITYILLCGRRPFWDKTEDGIFKEVLRNKPDFRRKPWSNISNSAKDFVKKLLVKDPRARLTAAQALSHPWVREGGDASEIPLDISVLSNMRQFVKYSRLKQFALRALASTLDEEELADLRDQFSAIDVDKNGVISLEEMRQALAKDLPWKMKESRVLEILQAIDSNTDGLVDFPEFVAATLHVHQLEEHNSTKWQQRSQAAFEKFDVDKDGFITPEELKMHTGLRGSVDPLLEEADIDKDGKISISEFRRLLRTASMSSPTRTACSLHGYGFRDDGISRCVAATCHFVASDRRAKEMKIVTYNVNGLRPRIQQYGSLSKLLDSLDADIICIQETKLSKHDLRADLVRAEGYESFFSCCTRNSDRGRSAGYSGVATFCRVKSAFLSTEVALPISAEEGFTGLLATSKGYQPRKEECPSIAGGLECFSRDELLKVDSEGRCLITDHGHFVLFNIYGPRAVQDDPERIQFKLTFFRMLERRWEFLLHQGRRIIIVGDLNIAPAVIDRCDAEPDFEKNEFRRWFRSLLVQNGGRLLDIFRAKHPDREGAYTCWSQSTGAEEFNYGSRIDHILSAGSCLHGEEIQEGHDFVTCHVSECDILMQFQRWKPGNTPRWKGGRSIKLEGSDHVPVYTSLVEIPEVLQHSTPPLSARYHPQVFGSQQTLAFRFMFSLSHGSLSFEFPIQSAVSMFTRRQTTEQVILEESESPQIPSQEELISTPEKYDSRASQITMLGSQSNANILPCIAAKKKARLGQGSQLTLKSFFQKRTHRSETSSSSFADSKLFQTDISYSQIESKGIPSAVDESSASKDCRSNAIDNTQHDCQLDACGSDKGKSEVALQEWQRIQQLMQTSVPLCKGHQEPCVSRVVKKAGPNLGRRFYVCARAEVCPAIPKDTSCDHLSVFPDGHVDFPFTPPFHYLPDTLCWVTSYSEEQWLTRLLWEICLTKHLPKILPESSKDSAVANLFSTFSMTPYHISIDLYLAPKGRPRYVVRKEPVPQQRISKGHQVTDFNEWGPSSNPEANCGYFKWAAFLKSKGKGK
ncbi:DNA-(apurinic or apyrimidinic site) lyase 2 [Capsicum annuum]|nr:DNA-(apurinic or apyrimidinic site) lyase 2 [Capsicum annuum]